MRDGPQSGGLAWLETVGDLACWFDGPVDVTTQPRPSTRRTAQLYWGYPMSDLLAPSSAATGGNPAAELAPAASANTPLSVVPGPSLRPSPGDDQQVLLAPPGRFFAGTTCDRGELLDGIDSRVDALVVAAMGVGHVPDRLVPALEKLAASMPVILASRTGAGPVLRDTYGFPGSERDLIGRGLLPAGFLHPLKARLLLGALIAAGADRQELAQAVAVAAGHADPATWPWIAETSQGA